jgi:hypothetical protein
MLIATLALVSAVAFFFYGGETLFANPPRGEYERYGMPRVRIFAGSMQLLGAAGLLLGLRFTPIGIAAAVGLMSMMVLGLIVRHHVHDAPRLMVPAGTLATLNGVLILLFVVGS